MKYKRLRRLTLRRHDGAVYLDRWGIGFKSLFTIYVHKMSAPDPGADLHDHPWAFVTIPLWGGYVEERASIRDASILAAMVKKWGGEVRRGVEEERRPWRPRIMRLDEAHTIIRLRGRTAWSLVLCGPVRRNWGFYLADGWVDHVGYETTDEGRQRLMEWSSNYKDDGASEAAHVQRFGSTFPR